MASTITSIDSQIAKLTTTFQTSIKATIDTESAPLKKVQTQRDSLDVRKGIYTDIKNNFDALQVAMQALISTQASYSLGLVSKSSVTSAISGSMVFNATASESAATADYDIAVTQLAKAESKASSTAYSPDAALGKTGTFYLGGSGANSVSLTGTDTLSASSASTVATGQRELGSGKYTLETRVSDGVKQFRLVNADGNAVSIRSQSGSNYTNTWQTMSTGAFDTGRGFSLTLNSSGSTSTDLTYTAAGTSLTISGTDSLRRIVTVINAASQPEGRDLKASIVANKLVLTSAQTGENHGMLFTDSAGLGLAPGVAVTLQSAQNAKFTVNSMAVSRSSNANLTDVVDGTTINLLSDAEGKSARLSITASTDKAADLVKTLVDKFNTTMNHLKDKLGSTASTGTNGKPVYTRGPLTGDISLSSLRTDILARMGRSYSNAGSLKNFSEIGISFDKDMKLTFDSTKFSAVYKNNAADVKSLLDTGLGAINILVSGTAGGTGSLSKMLTSIKTESANYDKSIARYTANLTQRKQTLYNQYINYQNQIIDYGYTQQYLDAIYGTTSTSA